MPPATAIEFHHLAMAEPFRLCKPDAATVGRSPENDWVLPAESISRFHARLEWPLDKPWPRIVDLGSANGTFVGGVRLKPNQPATVSRRTRLRLGKEEIETGVGFDANASPALLHDSSSAVELFNERGFRLSGRFGDWGDACSLLMRLEGEQRTGALRVDLSSGVVQLTVFLGQLGIEREEGVALLRRLMKEAGGAAYSFTSKLKIESRAVTGRFPSALLDVVRAGEAGSTREGEGA